MCIFRQKKFVPSVWTRAQALKVKADDPTTTQPLVPTDFPVMSEKLFIWDSWPLRNLDGDAVSVNGWNVLFTLAAERHPNSPEYTNTDGSYMITEDWENRHGNARIHYWYSKNAKDWTYGGRVMEEGVSPTSREWAGSTILMDRKGNIDLYYTTVTPGAHVAKVSGKIKTTESGVTLSGFVDVADLFEADGKMYQTEAQNPYWGFRDPWPFRDPKSGDLYMLFEGNVAGRRGSHVITSKEIGDVPPGHEDLGGSRYQTACIGIAKALDSKGNKWKLLPPLVTAVGVNDQTERPHFVFQDGKYYLFTISHSFTYADGLKGPDGVYGFVADKLFGNYKAMNSSGLVLGNPSSQPFQTYSHLMMKQTDGTVLATSFIDSVPKDDGYRIGGTEAPTVRVVLKDRESYVVEQLDYGYIPAVKNVKVK